MKVILILALVALTVSSSYADREREEQLCVKDCVTVWTWCMLENKDMPNHIKTFHRNGCKSNEVRCVHSCSGRRLLEQISTWLERLPTIKLHE